MEEADVSDYLEFCFIHGQHPLTHLPPVHGYLIGGFTEGLKGSCKHKEVHRRRRRRRENKPDIISGWM